MWSHGTVISPDPVSAVADDALGTMDTTALLAALRRREVGVDEVMSAARARAHAVQSPLNAMVAWTDPTSGGPLLDPASGGRAEDLPWHGVPIALKDNEDLLGLPTREGSGAVPDRPARRTSRFARQLAQLGTTIIGKSTLPEFGLTASTESTAFGATRNPWNPQHSVGGSSGGSAALVACGALPIAHANDGGGSIRIPAACCGLVGLKPSRSRLIDMEAMDHFPLNFTTQGVVSRTVRDTALFYAEMERIHRNPDLPAIGHVRHGGGARLRIGMVTSGVGNLGPDPLTVSLVRDAGAVCADLGHEVEEIPPPVTETFARDFLRFWGLMAELIVRGAPLLYGRDFDASRLERMTLGLAEFARSVALRIPGSLRRLLRHQQTYVEPYERFDLLLSPVLAHEPPPIGHLGPEVPFRDHLIRLLRFASFTAEQNISGAPAISVPFGTGTNGVPIGVQFSAPIGEEARLLRIAYQIEEARPWPLLPGL